MTAPPPYPIFYPAASHDSSNISFWSKPSNASPVHMHNSQSLRMLYKTLHNLVPISSLISSPTSLGLIHGLHPPQSPGCSSNLQGTPALQSLALTLHSHIRTVTCPSSSTLYFPQLFHFKLYHVRLPYLSHLLSASPLQCMLYEDQNFCLCS